MNSKVCEDSAVDCGKVDYGPEHIMVVDDEAGIRRFAARTLEKLGYSARLFADAEAALSEALTGDFALVLADVHLPGHDGRWLLDQLVTAVPDVAVIMITGDRDLELALECLSRGAVEYLTKPVAPRDLAHAVGRALENRRLRLENQAHRERLEELVQERTRSLLEATRALEESHKEAIYRLSAAAEYRDEETGLHIVRMARYAAIIAEELGQDEEFVRRLLLAAPMHDVGKIGIPDAILLKPDHLTPEEFEVMKSHTLIGGRILAGSNSPLLKMAETIALTHHEKFDGSGYPRGLEGEAIPVEGRITGLADVFDALTSRRVYKPAFPLEEALRIIESERGRHLDPRVVQAFQNRLPEILEVKKAHGDGEVAGPPRSGRAGIEYRYSLR